MAERIVCSHIAEAKRLAGPEVWGILLELAPGVEEGCFDDAWRGVRAQNRGEIESGEETHELTDFFEAKALANIRLPCANCYKNKTL